MATSGLAPLPGAMITNDFSGGLRGLRPPATFFGTLRVGEVSQLYSYHQEAYDRGKGCSITQLHNLTGGESRGPGPLKVVATQLARHIHHFADKVEPGNAPGFHCL